MSENIQTMEQQLLIQGVEEMMNDTRGFLYFLSERSQYKTLTYLDILEFHDEDCYRRGLPSYHTSDGKKSFKKMTIERRMHGTG